MKKLHLVGFTKDNDGLILSLRKGAKSGGYVVALDDQLISSIEQARHRAEGEPVDPAASGARDDASAVVDVRRARPRSALSPREIQARLRAGSTTADVAAQAGVEEEWVLRFADPILAEQAQVVASAQRLTFAKSRLGPSVEPLGQAVQWNLTDRGVRFSDDVFSDCWSAFNLHGPRWAVRFSYTSRQRRQVAEWEVDLRERSLTARNRLASDLGHVEAGRRRPRLEGQEQGQLEAAAPGPPARGGRPAAGAKSGAARPARPAGDKAPTRRSGRAPAATQKAAARSTAAKRSGAKITAAKITAAKITAAKITAAKKSGRQSAPRKSRPSKKPAADTPGGVGSATAAAPPEESFPDRPSHLARPASPMNMANRAASLPGRRFGSSYQQLARAGESGRTAAPSRAPQRPAPAARPAGTGEAAQQGDPPPAPAPAARPPRSETVRRPDQSLAGAEPAAGPASTAQAANGPSPSTSPPRAAGPVSPGTPERAPRPVAPPIRRPSSTASDGGDDEQRPAVVILSTPPSSPPRVGARRAGERAREEGRG